eukprot:g5375.t2
MGHLPDAFKEAFVVFGRKAAPRKRRRLAHKVYAWLGQKTSPQKIAHAAKKRAVEAWERWKNKRECLNKIMMLDNIDQCRYDSVSQQVFYPLPAPCYADGCVPTYVAAASVTPADTSDYPKYKEASGLPSDLPSMEEQGATPAPVVATADAPTSVVAENEDRGLVAMKDLVGAATDTVDGVEKVTTGETADTSDNLEWDVEPKIAPAVKVKDSAANTSPEGVEDASASAAASAAAEVEFSAPSFDYYLPASETGVMPFSMSQVEATSGGSDQTDGVVAPAAGSEADHVPRVDDGNAVTASDHGVAETVNCLQPAEAESSTGIIHEGDGNVDDGTPSASSDPTSVSTKDILPELFALDLHARVTSAVDVHNDLTSSHEGLLRDSPVVRPVSKQMVVIPELPQQEQHQEHSEHEHIAASVNPQIALGTGLLIGVVVMVMSKVFFTTFRRLVGRPQWARSAILDPAIANARSRASCLCSGRASVFLEDPAGLSDLPELISDHEGDDDGGSGGGGGGYGDQGADDDRKVPLMWDTRWVAARQATAAAAAANVPDEATPAAGADPPAADREGGDPAVKSMPKTSSLDTEERKGRDDDDGVVDSAGDGIEDRSVADDADTAIAGDANGGSSRFVDAQNGYVIDDGLISLADAGVAVSPTPTGTGAGGAALAPDATGGGSVDGGIGTVPLYSDAARGASVAPLGVVGDENGDELADSADSDMLSDTHGDGPAGDDDDTGLVGDTDGSPAGEAAEKGLGVARMSENTNGVTLDEKERQEGGIVRQIVSDVEAKVKRNAFAKAAEQELLQARKEAAQAAAKAAAELRAKREAEATVAAELKAKLEAEAEAKREAEAEEAAELKAKLEAEAKVGAELKVKLEAEAKVEAKAKATAELKAKLEAEAKAADEWEAKMEAAIQAAAMARVLGDENTEMAVAEGAGARNAQQEGKPQGMLIDGKWFSWTELCADDQAVLQGLGKSRQSPGGATAIPAARAGVTTGRAGAAAAGGWTVAAFDGGRACLGGGWAGGYPQGTRGAQKDDPVRKMSPAELKEDEARGAREREGRRRSKAAAVAAAAAAMAAAVAAAAAKAAAAAAARAVAAFGDDRAHAGGGLAGGYPQEPSRESNILAAGGGDKAAAVEAVAGGGAGQSKASAGCAADAAAPLPGVAPSFEAREGYFFMRHVARGSADGDDGDPRASHGHTTPKGGTLQGRPQQQQQHRRQQQWQQRWWQQQQQQQQQHRRQQQRWEPQWQQQQHQYQQYQQHRRQQHQQQRQEHRQHQRQQQPSRVEVRSTRAEARESQPLYRPPHARAYDHARSTAPRWWQRQEQATGARPQLDHERTGGVPLVIHIQRRTCNEFLHRDPFLERLVAGTAHQPPASSVS